MRNGSVGLVNLSLPSGSRGTMGRINMRITSTCSTTTQPTRLAKRTATRLLRMRQRSSSTWSRKGISPRFSRVSDTPAPPRPRPRTRERLPPQALELVAREVRLWRAGVAGDDPGVVRPRRCLVAPLLGEEAQLVERRRCPCPAPGRAGGPAPPAARAARSAAAGSGPSAPARSRAAAARPADRSSRRRAAAPDTPAARRGAPARRRAAPARSPPSPRAGYPRGPLDAQRLDLKLDAPDVAFQRASGGEPQDE